MGKVWPPDSVAYMEATTRLSTITALDESPLLEGLLYVGTDDGLIQVSEDGGKNWRKVESSALTSTGAPEFTYVTDVQASARDANTVFATLNDWNRGNFKPYVAKSTDRGRTWKSITGDLPERSGAWSIVQDTENENLLFLGMEFGLYATVDGGAHWVKMSGVPTIMVARRHDPEARGGSRRRARSAGASTSWTTYSALREVTSQGLSEAARLYPLRDAVSVRRARPVRGDLGQHHLSQPALRRAADLQHREGRCEDGDPDR